MLKQVQQDKPDVILNLFQNLLKKYFNIRPYISLTDKIMFKPDYYEIKY